MKNLYWTSLILALLAPSVMKAEGDIDTLSGQVVAEEKGEVHPLVGVRVSTLPPFAQTLTDAKGGFQLGVEDRTEALILDYAGFHSDTIPRSKVRGTLILQPTHVLDEVEIAYRRKSTEISLLSVRKTEQISERELLKAACCNLSESFETTPSVDVSITDAVTGYKQIQMLGLAGPYTFITRENIPDTRGLASITGLSFTPGTWIEGMQLSKGTGSVVNGYESVAGQLNVEWRKPFETEEANYLFNLYQNIQGRTEGNLVAKKEFSPYLSSNLFVHGRSQWRRMDENQDGFMDQPLDRQFIIANRWFWFLGKGWEWQWGAKFTHLENTGGQMEHQRSESTPQRPVWGYDMELWRKEAWMKIGKTFLSHPGTSMGLQLSYVDHDQWALYGRRDHQARQQSLYANYIFQTNSLTSRHSLKAGLSSQWDRYAEEFLGQDFSHEEIVPGVFAEYSWSPVEDFNLVAGIRADHHNTFGGFLSPRLHIRYALNENTVARASIGRAQRTAHIFAENLGFLASNRSVEIRGNSAMPYGLNPEITWNMGGNLLHKFRWNYRDGSVSLDYYYTHFQDQVVVDIEDPARIQFYNLEGRSEAHSIQVQLDYEVLRRFDLRLAYRWYDVRTQYQNGRRSRPLLSPHRLFSNLGYESRGQWKYDLTVQLWGPTRLPRLGGGNFPEKPGGNSPGYLTMNAQVSKGWGKRYELYLGVENITNYRMNEPILHADNPYELGFDASMIWGPIMGRNLYMGVRLRLD